MTPRAAEPPLTPGRGLMAAVAGKAVILLLVGAFIFSPVFHGGWLLEDDNAEVAANAVIQGPGGLTKIWLGGGSLDYLPLKTSLLWLLWRCFGNDPTGYHLTSLALHLISALLAWRVFGRLGMRRAWIGGLLFVVHPIVVESVAWISELKNTLSMVFLLLTMLAWLDWDEKRRWPDYARSLALFVAALLCKASVIMWPVVILMYAGWKRGRVSRVDTKTALPFFAVALAAAVVAIWLQNSRAISTETYPLGGWTSRLALAEINLAFYLWKIVWPVGLLPMYPQWRIAPPSVVDFLPWPVLAGGFLWLWTNRGAAWAKVTLFGWGFFAVNLVPVLGFFQMAYMRIAWTADHFAYVPSLGAIGSAVAGFSAGYDRLDEKHRPLGLGAGILALGLLTFGSYRHAKVYANIDALCRYTLSPKSRCLSSPSVRSESGSKRR